MRFIATELNGLGGEWLTDMQIGENPKLFTEFYQPLSLASRYFFAPQFDFEERSVFELRERDRVAEYRVREVSGGVAVGREISNWGEIRVGMRRGTGRRRVLIGDPSLPNDEFDRGGYFARFSYDGSTVFSFRATASNSRSSGARSARASAPKATSTPAHQLAGGALVDRHTLIFWIDAGTTVDALARPRIRSRSAGS